MVYSSGILTPQWLVDRCTILETIFTIVSTGSGLCLDDGLGPVKIDSRTCAAGSVAAEMQFCDSSLSFEQRASALVANLTLAEKITLFMVGGMLSGVPRLNIKKFGWDSTDIHGVDPQQVRDAVLEFVNQPTHQPRHVHVHATPR